MQRRSLNPWPWSVEMGFQQGVLVESAARTLYVSGQTAMSADGVPQHAGDMAGQVNLAIDNMEAVLADASMTLGDVVRLTAYATDIDAFFGALEPATERFAAAGAEFTSTLLEVQRLAFPELMVELEATAVS